MTHDDEILGRAYDSRLMRRLGVFVAPYWRPIALTLLLMTLGALIELAPPFLVKQAIDGPIAARDVDGIIPIFAWYVLALLGSFVLRYIQTSIIQSTSQHIMVDIRMRLFDHIQQMSLAFFDRNPVGRLITRITNDVNTLNEFMTQGTVALLGDVVRFVFVVVTMFILNWRLALIVALIFPVLIVTTAVFQRVMRRIFREVRRTLAQVNAFLNEQITGVLVTQLFNREQQSRTRFGALSNAYQDAQFRSLIAYAVFFPVVGFLSAASTAMLLNLGGLVVLDDLATIGMLIAFLQYADQAFQPIRQIAERYNTLQSAMASSERIFGILDTPADVQDAPQTVPLAQPVRGEIEFRDVVFGYNPSEPVLRGVSFRIPAGQSVAVVGATGAGKTSLVSLMARFYDIQQGSITLDGVDIRQIAQAELRRHIGAVPQDPTCFSGTIASNIRMHDLTISDEQVRRAAAIANAAPFIERLPGGYDYDVRERGANLSVGQRQLLAFARAIAFNPEVLLILDEATSSVDTATEALMQAALVRLLHGRTSIVIAHRLSTIRHVDRILVLHRGLLVEDGSHEALLAQRGRYYRLYQQQFAEQATSSPPSAV
ncbi:MAG: ABC transporter ATP-binding protein/permease [Chloroflexi bacterium]|nr:ABC transporter ATP-binding protein/permease [Chloroflexota bacterium]